MLYFIKKHWIPVLAGIVVATAIIVGVVFLLDKDKNETVNPGQSSGTGDMVTITFVTDGSPVETVQVEKGTCVTAYPNTSRAGYGFAGWYTDGTYNTPWYISNPIDDNLVVYAKFEESEPEIEEYHSNSLYIEDVPADYKIGVLCDASLSEKEILNSISLVTEFGEEPKLTAKTENGICYLGAEGGFYAGGSYTVILPENMHFDGLDAYVDTFSFRVHKDEIQKVELKETIKYVDTAKISWDIEARCFKAEQSIMDEYGFSVGDVLCVGDGTASFSEDIIFVNITEIQQYDDGSYLVFTSDSDVSDVYNDIDVYVKQTLTSLEAEELFDLDALEKSVYESGMCEDMATILAYALNADPTYLSLVNDASDSGITVLDSVVTDTGITMLETTGVASGITTLRATGAGSGITALKSAGTDYKVLQLGSTGGTGDAYDFASKVTPKGKQVKADINDLLKGVSVSVTSAKVTNANFEIPDENGWKAISIKFTYETTLRQKVKIHAELEIVESINVSAQGYMENKNDLDNLEFDFALNFYTQTDMIGTILVCSTSAQNEMRGDWINITDEINALTSGEDDSAPETLVAKMQEMLDEKGDYVKLLEVPVMMMKVPVPPVLPLFQLNIGVNLVVRVNFAAGLSSKMSVLDATQVGIKGSAKDKHIEGYTNSLVEGGRYSYSLAACGYIGLRAGVEGKLTLSLVGLDRFGEIGAAVEVGAYTDIYGYTDLSIVKEDRNKDPKTRVRGGYYMEVGIYGSLKLIAEASAFKVEAEKTLMDIQVPLLTLGNRYLLMSIYESEGIYYMHSNSASLTDVIPITGQFMDLTTGEIVSNSLPSDVKFNAVFTNSMFSYDSRNGRIYVTRDKNDPKHTAETEIYLYYGGASLIFSDAKNLDGDYAYVGTYTIRWIAPEADISEEDFGKIVRATYYGNVNGELIEVGYREVEAGTVPGQWVQSDGLLTLYYEWNINPWAPIDKDTDFITRATAKNVLVGFVWYEDDIWKTEVRAMSVGQTPVLPVEAADHCTYAKLKGWSVSYGSAVSDDSKLQTGIVTEAATIPMQCFKYLSYLEYPVEQNKLMFSASERTKNWSWSQFTGIMHKDSDGNEFYSGQLYAVYFAEYDYTTFEVTFNSKRSSLYDIEDRTSVQNVIGGQSPRLPEYYVPLCKGFLGWDADGDGIADYDNYHLPIITSDTTFNAVYADNVIEIVGKVYDAKNRTYIEKRFNVVSGEVLPKNVIDELSTPVNVEAGIEWRLQRWEVNGYILQDNNYIYTEFPSEDRIIVPVFRIYYDISFDKGEGEMDSYYSKTLPYEYNAEFVMPESVIKYDGVYARCVATWVDQDGIEYAAGEKVRVTKPMNLTAKYDRKLQVYKVSVTVASEKGVLLNGKQTDSYEGDKAGYIEFVKKYDAYMGEDVYDEDYVYHFATYGKIKQTDHYDTETTISFRWDKLPRYYTMTFDAGEGTFKSGAKKITDTAEIYTDYSPAGISEKDSVEGPKKNYVLVGWKDTAGKVYGPNDTINVYRDMTFTAVWEAKNYTLTFKTGGGKFLDSNNSKSLTVTVEYGEEYPLSKIVDENGIKRLDENGEYVLTGWRADDGKTYKSDEIYLVEGDATLTAVWRNIYAVVPEYTYIIRAGDVELFRGTAEAGEVIYYEEAVIGSGYEDLIIGWSSNVSLTFKKDEYGGKYLVMPAKDFTLVAKLKKVTEYTLTFDAGEGHFVAGGGGKRYTVTVTMNQEYNLWGLDKEIGIVREDGSYRLKGWKDDSGKFYAVDGIYTVKGNAGLSAVWELIE